MRFNSLPGLVALFALFATAIGHASDSINYFPQLHGVFRGRWEIETDDGYSHFQVRNARLSLEGKLAPILSYKLQTDFCDRGKFVMLDAFATLTPARGVAIKVGQYRMPFGYASFRGPASYYFNNRSVIQRYVNNYRAVGLSGGYTFSHVPITIEAGVFNPTVITDHTKWVKKYAYAGRILFRPDDFVITAGFQSIIPDSVRVNLAGATVGWGRDRFYAEGEYMARMYSNNTHKTTHAFSLLASYGIPLPKSIFDTWSFQARVDGMDDLAGANTPLGPDGKLPTTQDGRTRLTLGTTLDYNYKSVRASVRLNYEKCWYADDHVDSPGTGDMVSAELIIKF